MNDIGQLRADLEVLKRYEPMVYSLAAARAEIENKIARLEAEADPWRDAKMRLVEFKLFTDDVGEFRPVKDYVDHLTAENDRLAKRVAELEAEIKAEDDADIADAEKALAEMVRANQDMGLYEANADTSEHKPRRPHDRITMQRRIKMQRRELRRLNKKMYDQAFERHRLKCRIAELEDGLAAIDPDGYQLGDFRVMKTAQEIARYAMDRNMDQPVTVKTARRAIWAIKEFVEQARHWHGLSKLQPYRWTSLGRDDKNFIDQDFDTTESPCDYDPDAHKPRSPSSQYRQNGSGILNRH